MIDIPSIATRTEPEPTVSLVGTSSSEKLLARRLRLSEFTCGKNKVLLEIFRLLSNTCMDYSFIQCLGK